MSVRAGFDYAIYNTTTNVPYAGGRDASVSLNAEVIDLTSRDTSNWQVSVSGARSWSMTTSNVLLSNTSIGRSGILLDFRQGSNVLKGLTSATLSVSSGTAQVVNNTTGYDTINVGTRRSATVSLTTQMYDQSEDGMAEVLWNRWTDGASFNAVLLVSTNVTLTADFLVTNINRSAPYEGIVEATYELQVTGTPTFLTTGLNTTQASVWTSINDTVRSSVVAVAFAPKYTATIPTSNLGKNYYKGNAIATEFSITIPHTGEVTLDATWTGTGALTKITI